MLSVYTSKDRKGGGGKGTDENVLNNVGLKHAGNGME